MNRNPQDKCHQLHYAEKYKKLWEEERQESSTSDVARSVHTSLSGMFGYWQAMWALDSRWVGGEGGPKSIPCLAVLF